ncbi:MAG: MAC/perforin domain-containing protein [Bacteroidota bacterium]
MIKKLHFKILSIGAIFALLNVVGCKKDISRSENTNDTSTKDYPTKIRTHSASDGVWDLLGYGLDVTDDMLNSSSISDAPIFDVKKFAADYLNRIDVGTTGSGVNKYYGGATALDYMKDISNTKSFDVNGNSTIDGSSKTDPLNLNFKGSLSKSSFDENKTTYSNLYSYATYEVNHPVKRIRFTQDVSVDLLMNYLTPEFLSNIATKSADELVARYGTHVMLDITIGGRFRFDYSGSTQKGSNYTKKTSDVKMGLGFSLAKIVGININSDKTTAEITEATTTTSRKQYTARYYGGTNGGTSITIDKDGNTSQTVNLASWEQSVNANNAALIDVGNAVFLYNFITDPVKKAAVKAAVEKHIKDNQITLVEDYTNELVDINSFAAKKGGDHYLSTGFVSDLNYWNFIGSQFRAYPRQIPGTVAVNAYFSQQGVDHLFTVGTVSDLSWWKSEGIAFYAYTTNVAGTIPIYAHTSKDGKDHYYSTDGGVLDANYWSPVVPVAFYAYPRSIN